MSGQSSLNGVRIINSRALHQLGELTELIERNGGISIEIPFLKITKTKNITLRSFFPELSPGDWLVFTSKNGIKFFFEHMEEEGFNKRDVASFNVAVVGEKTKQYLHKYGIQASLMPKTFTGEDLAKELVQKVPKTKRIVVVRGNLAKPSLRQSLIELGYHCIDFIVYETIEEIEQGDKLYSSLLNYEVDYITFTSSSTVRSFMSWCEERNFSWHHLSFACIGKVTEETLRSYQAHNVLVPERFTLEDMLQTIVEDVEMKRRST